MAKIRGIKPEFWTDEDIVDLTIPARLLFIGLWNFACDNGHLADKSKQIKMRVLPADDVNVAELLRELVEKGRIDREDGTITVRNFTRHQRVDKRYFTVCQVPGCEPPAGDSQHETRRAPNGNTTGAHGAHGVNTKGTPGDGDGDGDGDGERRVSRRSPETTIPGDWQPSDSHRSFAADKRIDLEREAFKFRNHALANDRRQRNWNAAFTTWLAKAEEFAPAVAKRNPNLPEGW